MTTFTFPVDPHLNDTYTVGTRTYRWTGYAWAIVTGTITTGNTSVSGNAITTGNTTITGNALTTGNTTITGNALTTGNTTITDTGLTTGNTTITGNAITTGNTSITDTGLTTGNTTITGNAITTGNTTITNTGLTTGNTTITGNAITTGNTTITGNGLTVGNTTITSISVATETVTTTTLTVGNATIGNLHITGSVTGVNFGMVSQGSDPSNWDTNVTLGLYYVNRVSWSGTVGTPSDAYGVGLLMVLPSNDAIVQRYQPSETDASAAEYFRSKIGAGAWTSWYRTSITSGNLDGGSF